MRAVDIVRALCPRAHPNYVAAFERGDAALAEAGITTPLRLAHFLAQVFHETGKLTILEESGRYSAKNLGRRWDQRLWRRYFASRDEMVAMAQQCARDGGMALFNRVYGNRMGNGPPESGDGWRYRGRGVLQTTGREAYRKYGARCGCDFEAVPGRVTEPEWALAPALAEWVASGCNRLADRNAAKQVGNAINRGNANAGDEPVGFDDRVAWFDRIWAYMQAAEAAPPKPSWQASDPDPDVEALQRDLGLLGFPVEADGRKGPKTVAAIKAFQVSAGLPASGVADDPTRIAMQRRKGNDEGAKAPRPETANPPAVDNAAGKGGGLAGGGIAGEVVLQQAERIEPIADAVPWLRILVVAVTLVGVGLILYGAWRTWRPRPGAPS
jgi:putative chitinase